MPALSAPAKVLVTGGTGYIGSWVVKDLIERGYNLVVAVRNDKAGEEIAATYPGKTSHVIVTDIVAEGAYDEAVKTVDAVVHIASPVIFTFEDPQDHIGPAVGGALGILKSAAKAPNVKRVVITGSAISVNFFADTQPHKYNETEWDVVSPALVKEHGKNVNPWAVYAASKTLAEKAAWDWVKENKPSYDLVYILPSINFGPWAHNVASRDKLGSTIGVLFSTFAAGGDSSGAYVAGWVDVRDTSKVHVLALESEEAANERIINNSGSFAWQDVYDILNERGFPNIPKGIQGAGKGALKIEFDNAKSLKLFPELKYRDLETSVGDMGEQINKHGWFIPAESPAVASSPAPAPEPEPTKKSVPEPAPTKSKPSSSLGRTVSGWLRRLRKSL